MSAASLLSYHPGCIAEKTKRLHQGVSQTRNMESKKPYLFIAPHFLLFLLFTIIPVVYSIGISLYKWNFIGAPTFVGLENYRLLLIDTQSPYHREFMQALKNNIVYIVFGVPIFVFIPIILASALSRRPPGAAVMQAIFFIPSILSVSTVAIMCRWIFDRKFGLVNNFLGLNISWTTAEPWFWVAIVLINLWCCTGGNLVIYMAGIADIPKDIYEAASLDGANAIHQFFYITIPGLSYQIRYALIMTIISSFKIYGEVLMFSGSTGRPSMDKNVPMISIQQTAFGEVSNAGMASAMAVILSLLIIVFSVISLKMRLEKNRRSTDET